MIKGRPFLVCRRGWRCICESSAAAHGRDECDSTPSLQLGIRTLNVVRPFRARVTHGDEHLRKRALRHSRTQRDRARALLELDDTLGRARELARRREE